MKSFRQYLQEVFTFSTQKQKDDHPRSHPDITHYDPDSDMAEDTIHAIYAYTHKDDEGKPLYVLRTSMKRMPHGTEVEFTVNGAWEKEKLAADRQVPMEHLPHLMSKIHSHVDHFQRTHGGFGKSLFFWTDSKKKNSLYHHIARDAGVPGVNLHDDDRAFYGFHT